MCSFVPKSRAAFPTFEHANLVVPSCKQWVVPLEQQLHVLKGFANLVVEAATAPRLVIDVEHNDRLNQQQVGLRIVDVTPREGPAPVAEIWEYCRPHPSKGDWERLGLPLLRSLVCMVVDRWRPDLAALHIECQLDANSLGPLVVDTRPKLAWLSQIIMSMGTLSDVS